MKRLNMSVFTMKSLDQVICMVATFVGLSVFVAFGDSLKGNTLTPAIAFSVASIVGLCEKQLVNLYMGLKSIAGIDIPPPFN
jgi:hypothetical protein